MGEGRQRGAGQIKSADRVRDYGEVFTLPETVSDMVDLIPEEMLEPGRNWLEPCCGEGIIVLEVLRRKFERCRKKVEYEAAALSVWGMDIQADNVEITIRNVLDLCRERFHVSKKLEAEIRSRFILCDSLKVMNLLSMYEGGMLIFVRGERT